MRRSQFPCTVHLLVRYESNRLEYDTAKRAYQSQNTPDNEDKMIRVRMRYEEARDAYYEKLQHSQDDDHEHLEHLKAYARAMVRYAKRALSSDGRMESLTLVSVMCFR